MSGINREIILETRISLIDKHLPGTKKAQNELEIEGSVYLFNDRETLENEWEFGEIWVDPLISPPYILILVKEKSGKFCVHNPAQNYKVIFASDDYEVAKMWLLEDEYERLNSRIIPEL